MSDNCDAVSSSHTPASSKSSHHSSSGPASAPNTTTVNVEVDGKQQALTMIEGLMESISAALTQAGAAVNELKDTRQRAMFETLEELRLKLLQYAEAGVDRALPVYLKADEWLHIADHVYATTQRLLELDETYGVYRRVNYIAQRAGLVNVVCYLYRRFHWLDQRLTKGTVEPAFLDAFAALLGAVEHVAEKYRETNEEHHSEPAADVLKPPCTSSTPTPTIGGDHAHVIATATATQAPAPSTSLPAAGDPLEVLRAENEAHRAALFKMSVVD